MIITASKIVFCVDTSLLCYAYREIGKYKLNRRQSWAGDNKEIIKWNMKEGR
jgi:hypothetical protein